MQINGLSTGFHEQHKLTEDKIGNLLGLFTDDVINVFSTKMPDLFGENSQATNDPTNPMDKPVITA